MVGAQLVEGVCWRRPLADMWSEEWEKGVLLLSVGGRMQCIVTAWPGDESMKGEVVRVSTLPGTVAGKG